MSLCVSISHPSPLARDHSSPSLSTRKVFTAHCTFCAPSPFLCRCISCVFFPLQQYSRVYMQFHSDKKHHGHRKRAFSAIFRAIFQRPFKPHFQVSTMRRIGLSPNTKSRVFLVLANTRCPNLCASSGIAKSLFTAEI